MTKSLSELCELQIENEKIIRKASFLELDDIIKVGALFYTVRDLTPDAEKIRVCKGILKKKDRDLLELSWFSSVCDPGEDGDLS